MNLKTIAGSLALAWALLGCSQLTDHATTDVMIKDTGLGKVLTDASGRTLYMFARDVSGNSVCEGNCANNWPAFYRENPSLGSGLAMADFGSITRTDGSKQITYKGWPLYYYRNDAAAGDTKGDNVGGIWFTAKPHFSLMLGLTQLKGHDGKNYLETFVEGNGETAYLVDSLGRALYSFSVDKKEKNTFTRADFGNNTVWPIAEIEAKNIPSALKASDFGSITVFGRKQLTYKGWPIYYFGQDSFQRGMNKGVSFPRPGVWPIVNQKSLEAPL